MFLLCLFTRQRLLPPFHSPQNLHCRITDGTFSGQSDTPNQERNPIQNSSRVTCLRKEEKCTSYDCISVLESTAHVTTHPVTSLNSTPLPLGTMPDLWFETGCASRDVSRWCLRLLRQAKALATLHNVNAKLSTLGGGYYLTRQVGQAIQLARAQSQAREESLREGGVKRVPP